MIFLPLLPFRIITLFYHTTPSVLIAICVSIPVCCDDHISTFADPSPSTPGTLTHSSSGHSSNHPVLACFLPCPDNPSALSLSLSLPPPDSAGHLLPHPPQLHHQPAQPVRHQPSDQKTEYSSQPFLGAPSPQSAHDTYQSPPEKDVAEIGSCHFQNGLDEPVKVYRQGNECAVESILHLNLPA